MTQFMLHLPRKASPMTSQPPRPLASERIRSSNARRVIYGVVVPSPHSESVGAKAMQGDVDQELVVVLHGFMVA
ncbi:hypothetical protein N7528_005353 [Penicillium herquei]|nr:hypothetical protein N7528_005353 [Penicillium herquei]